MSQLSQCFLRPIVCLDPRHVGIVMRARQRTRAQIVLAGDSVDNVFISFLITFCSSSTVRRARSHALCTTDENRAAGRTAESAAWGNSCAGVAQGARAGSAATGLLLPRPTAGGVPGLAITAGLVSATAVLMVTFTASSIGSLKGTSMRSSPCS